MNPQKYAWKFLSIPKKKKDSYFKSFFNCTRTVGNFEELEQNKKICQEQEWFELT